MPTPEEMAAALQGALSNPLEQKGNPADFLNPMPGVPTPAGPLGTAPPGLNGPTGAGGYTPLKSEWMWKPEYYDRLKSMVQQGRSVRSIADELGVSKSYVQKKIGEQNFRDLPQLPQPIQPPTPPMDPLLNALQKGLK